MTGRASLFVALGEVELHFPGARSLKDKRHDLRSLIDRLRARCTVLIVESDHKELHQRAGLALSSLAADADAARATVARALDLLHSSCAGVVLEERINVVQVR